MYIGGPANKVRETKTRPSAAIMIATLVAADGAVGQSVKVLVVPLLSVSSSSSKSPSSNAALRLQDRTSLALPQLVCEG